MSDLSHTPKDQEPELAEGEVLQEEDKNVRDGSKRKVIMHAEVSEWNWYLPPPEVFEKYSADVQQNIMNLVGRESKHRHSMEEKSLTANIKRDSRGQRYVLLIVLGVVLTTAVLIWNGSPNGVYVMFGIAPALLGPLVGVIIQMFQRLFRQNEGGQKEDKGE